MSAFIVFFAAVFCILFFVLGSVFKAAESMIKGLLRSLGMTILIALFVGIALVLIFAVYGIAEGIRTGGMGNIAGMIILIVADAAVLFVIVGPIGGIVLSAVVAIAAAVISAMAFILGGASNLMEAAYTFFLNKIKGYVEKEAGDSAGPLSVSGVDGNE